MTRLVSFVATSATTVLALALGARTANAQQPPPPQVRYAPAPPVVYGPVTPPPPPPPAPPPPVAYGAPPPPVVAYAGPPPASFHPRHTGFYLRLALGGGGFTDSFRLESANVGYDATATGGTFASELGIGGALLPGLILGGALYGETMVNPTVTVAGFPAASNVSVGTLGMIGPFLEWYPNPERGFHLGGAVTAARITLSDSAGNITNNSIVGGGLVFDIGYEWWLADEWGLGVMGRLIGAGLSDGTVHHDVGGGSVLASLTFN